MSIIVRRVVNGAIDNNTYILHNEGNTTAIVIDPSSDGSEVIDALEEGGLTCGAIALTHGHYDHITGVNALVEKYGAKVYVHEADADMLANPKTSLAVLWTKKPFACKADVLLKDGEELTCAGLTLKVLHTPGHTGGGVCYICGGMIFSGDTMFYKSCGRTDFPNSSEPALRESFKRLYALQGDYAVYPGHGNDTTLEFERKNNLFVRA